MSYLMSFLAGIAVGAIAVAAQYLGLVAATFVGGSIKSAVGWVKKKL